MSYEYRPGTPIDPKDIRVGDRVRWIENHADAGSWSTQEFTVQQGAMWWIGNPDREPDRDWELIERPKPELKAGQIWLHGDGEGNQHQTVLDDNAQVVFVDQQGYLRGASFWERESERLTYVGEAEITVKS